MKEIHSTEFLICSILTALDAPLAAAMRCAREGAFVPAIFDGGFSFATTDDGWIEVAPAAWKNLSGKIGLKLVSAAIGPRHEARICEGYAGFPVGPNEGSVFRLTFFIQRATNGRTAAEFDRAEPIDLGVDVGAIFDKVARRGLLEAAGLIA